jgi:RNA polymerase sigma factor (sigma-70 family)
MGEDRHGLRPLLERVLRDRDRTRDGEAWNELMGRLRALARALLTLRVRADDASDLAQEVQQRVLRYFHAFRGETVESLLAWVNCIISSVEANYRAGRPPAEPLREDPADQRMDSSLVFDPEQLDQVLRALAQLPEPGRTLVRAFYLEGRKCVQIAADLQRSAEWVRVNKMHAVRALRGLLGVRHEQ